MKQFMIDAMAAMMPFMRPISILSFVLIAVGLVLALFARGGGPGRLAAWCGTFVVLAGFFFLACEIAGRFLGFEPTILYAAPLDRELYRNQWPFWIVGALFLCAGMIIRGFARSRAS